MTIDEDQIFSTLLFSVTSKSIAPEAQFSRYRLNELSPRSYFLKKSAFSSLLTKLEELQELIDNNDLEKRIQLCEKSSVGLTVYHSLQYISFQFRTSKNPFFFNLKKQEWMTLHPILVKIRRDRDEKLKILRAHMDHSKPVQSAPQTTIYEIFYKYPDSDEEHSQIYFDLEEGISETTDDGCIVTSTQRRKVDIPSLATVTVMFATILHKAKKAGHIKDELDPVMLAKHIEIFYDTICVNPHISSELLTASRFSLESLRPIDVAYTSGILLNAVLDQAGFIDVPNFMPDQPSGWMSKLGISPNVPITY